MCGAEETIMHSFLSLLMPLKSGCRVCSLTGLNGQQPADNDKEQLGIFESSVMFDVDVVAGGCGYGICGLQ